MAITKTHPIKSTLKAAIDYICNPAKTDGKLLVSSFGCAAETADIEFEWTRRHAIDKGTNLGRHLIQAFAPGEVSPEEAHEIGMELAKEILGGKYEFVLTTHIDKGHIHNHLLWNAVSQALRHGHGDVLKEIRVDKGRNIRRGAPTGTAVLHPMPVLFHILASSIDCQPEEQCPGNADQQIRRIQAWQWPREGCLNPIPDGKEPFGKILSGS